MALSLEPQFLADQLVKLAAEQVDIQTSLSNSDTNGAMRRDLSIRYSEVSDLVSLCQNLTKLQTQLVENTELEKQADSDVELKSLLIEENQRIENELSQMENKFLSRLLPPEPEDQGNAIIEIRAAAGGDESALFAQEMFRAYSKFAEGLGLTVELANISYGNVGGFKEVIFFVSGASAYKYFKYESGVHRVQRVPATEAAGRIHTSTVSVVVMAEVDDVQVNIRDEDLRIDVYRAGGPGGQSVNTTDSAVRIVHKPTGIIVTCQDEKSQHKNKAKAMKILLAKLFDLAKQAEAAKLSQIRQSAIKTGDRSAKIRTYNFPQARITDHRIKVSWHNINEVMEGDLEEITTTLAAAYNKEKLQVVINEINATK